MAELLTTYSSLRLQAVDACVIALAERLDLHEVAALDRRDFQVVAPRHNLVHGPARSSLRRRERFHDSYVADLVARDVMQLSGSACAPCRSARSGKCRHLPRWPTPGQWRAQMDGQPWNNDMCCHDLHCGLFPHWLISVLSCGNNVLAPVFLGFAACWTAVASDGERRGCCSWRAEQG
jgi:hypothetical protein